MATIVKVDCEECEGSSIVKITNEFSEDFTVNACPLCGAAYVMQQDTEDDE